MCILFSLLHKTYAARCLHTVETWWLVMGRDRVSVFTEVTVQPLIQLKVIYKHRRLTENKLRVLFPCTSIYKCPPYARHCARHEGKGTCLPPSAREGTGSKIRAYGSVWKIL